MTATAVKKLSWQTTPDASAKSFARNDGEYMRWDADISSMVLLLLWKRKQGVIRSWTKTCSLDWRTVLS